MCDNIIVIVTSQALISQRDEITLSRKFGIYDRDYVVSEQPWRERNRNRINKAFVTSGGSADSESSQKPRNNIYTHTYARAHMHTCADVRRLKLHCPRFTKIASLRMERHGVVSGMHLRNCIRTPFRIDISGMAFPVISEKLTNFLSPLWDVECSRRIQCSPLSPPFRSFPSSIQRRAASVDISLVFSAQSPIPVRQWR